MSSERVAEIEARVNAATPGPWENNYRDLWTVEADGGEGEYLAEVERKGDADFLFHAREDIPWLLEQLRAAEQSLEMQPLIAMQGDALLSLELDDREAERDALAAQIEAVRALCREGLAPRFANASVPEMQWHRRETEIWLRVLKATDSGGL